MFIQLSLFHVRIEKIFLKKFKKLQEDPVDKTVLSVKHVMFVRMTTSWFKVPRSTYHRFSNKKYKEDFPTLLKNEKKILLKKCIIHCARKTLTQTQKRSYTGIYLIHKYRHNKLSP